MNRFPLVERFAQKQKSRTGQGLVEFALVIPILLLVMYGMLEVGRLVFIYATVVTAAREAARYGSASGIVSGLDQYCNPAGIKAAAQNVDFLNAFSDAEILISYDYGPATATFNPCLPHVVVVGGNRIVVEISTQFNPLVRIVPIGAIPLRSQSARTLIGQVAVGNATPAGGGSSTPSPIRPPIMTKNFLPLSVVLGETSTLIFTIGNPNGSSSFSDIEFSDTYPTGLVNSTPLVTENTCSGNINASAGGNNITFSGGILAAYKTCTLSIVVIAASTGTYTNTSSEVNSTQGGTGNATTSTLHVTPAALICNNNKVVHGSIFTTGNTLSTMTINNNTGLELRVKDISITWNNDHGHQSGGDKTLTLTQIDLGTSSHAISTGNNGPSYTLPNSDWALPPGRTTIIFTFHQSYDNMDGTELITMNFTNPDCAGFLFDSSVNSPPVISKAFSPEVIAPAGLSTLTFTITNPNNAAIGLAGIAFKDIFPDGVTQVGTYSSLQCLGTVTATSSSITLTGGLIPAENSCTVVVTVQANSAGTYINTSGAVTSTNGGTGNTASATLFVSVLPPSFSYKRFSPSSIEVNGASILSIRIRNRNTSTALTDVTFTDNFPEGMRLASPITASQCDGTVSSTSDTLSDSITYLAPSLPGGFACILSVSVTAADIGSYPNSTGFITSTNTPTGNSASATLTVVNVKSPSIGKYFSPATIEAGAQSTLTITINNPNNVTTLTGLNLLDTYPSGMVNATSPAATTNCTSGSLTAVAGGAGLSLTGASLAPSVTCTVTVQVTAAVAGSYVNSNVVVTTTNGVSGNAVIATLTVGNILTPGISKSFSPASIEPGLTSTLTFTIVNPNTLTTLTGIAFTDTFPVGMTVANAPSPAQCNGIVENTSDSITFSGGSIAPSDHCTVSVNVTATTIKPYANTSGAVSSTNGFTGNTASATLTVTAIKAATISKSFSPSTTLVDTATTLTFNLYNPNSATSLSGIAFSDTYPTWMVNKSPLVTTNNCGGTVSSIAGDKIALSGGSLDAGHSCTVTVSVTASTAGTYSNTSGTITSTNGPPGGTATASVLVITAPCNSSTVLHTAITYPSSTQMQMTITNNTGKTLTLNQVKVWWNYAYGHYKTPSFPRNPLSIYQVGLGSVLLYGPGHAATSPLTISGSGNVLAIGTSSLTVTFVSTYDNHEYDAFSVNFTNSECSGFTVSAPP